MALELKSLGGGLHYVEGTVQFFGMQLVTRMEVVELNSGGLLIVSPLQATDELAALLDPLGAVRYVVSPNKIHNQGLPSFAERYKEAEFWASPGLPERRPELSFQGVLSDGALEAWSADLEQLVTEGNSFFSEVVFFHKKSKTLIVADLVENIDHASVPTRLSESLVKLMHIYGRPLASPEFRTYTDDPAAAYDKMLKMNEWPFETILLAHGAIITENAHEVFMNVAEHLFVEANTRPPHRRALYAAIAKRQ